jgi:hypothetical protein
MEGSPKFRLFARSSPIGFEASADGSAKGLAGPFVARVDEIPFTLRIPFLRRGRGLQTVASIGTFGVRLERFEVEAQAFGVRVGGILAKDVMRCTMGGTVACKTEIDMTGTIPGKVAKVAIQLADEEDVE